MVTVSSSACPPHHMMVLVPVQITLTKMNAIRYSDHNYILYIVTHRHCHLTDIYYVDFYTIWLQLSKSFICSKFSRF